MKYKTLLLLACLMFTLGACFNDDGINGQGPIVIETRTVDAFTAIRSSLPASVFISQDTEQSLRIETHENVLPIIDSYVRNGELMLELNRSVRNIDRLNVYISAEDYERIRLSGAANLNSEGCLNLNDLEIRLSGAGNINVCGTAESLVVDISGAGNFQGFGMVAQNVNASVSGAGNMRVTAEQALDVTISGSGSIYYKGNPQINSNISGAGRLIDAN